MQEIRRNYYFPSIAKHARAWLKQCETCIKDKRINNMKLRREIFNVPEWDMEPDDAVKIDLLPELPPSGGYQNIVTAMIVISRYALAYPVSSPTAVNPANVIIDTMTRHAYLRTIMIKDKRSVFMSQVIIEVAAVLGKKLKHATTKHAQAIRDPERTHATKKTSLKMTSGEYRKQWHKTHP